MYKDMDTWANSINSTERPCLSILLSGLHYLYLCLHLLVPGEKGLRYN